jgi:hypothetical protein
MKLERVRVGQIWQDWDIRWRDLVWPRPRKLKIIAITDDRKYAQCENIDTGKLTLIRVDRFKPTSTGYKLVER